MKKSHLLILFGGQSSEHEVSCRSAVSVIRAIDTDEYDRMIIGITKDGRWILVEGTDEIEKNCWQQGKTEAVLSPEASKKGVWLRREGESLFWPVDIVFPVLHGTGGEDGAVQGLLELAGLPYVGCGILASALSMDKAYTKVIVERLGICQASCVAADGEQVRTERGLTDSVQAVEEKLTYPVFVKPSASGSSCGVAKAANREELKAGLRQAAGYGPRILVEEAVTGRELECAVLGGPVPRASGVGEILPGADFYDYDAKYNSNVSRTVIDPRLPEGVEEKIREASVEIFRAVDGRGLARVDFFLEDGSDRIVFNEINTMPGFTDISMYPLLWEAAGLPVEELVKRLLHDAGERAKRETQDRLGRI
ncbi:MAG: D-alanine--D-alanine ligase [Lachnospiraceae bacterium]|jgi:D-alanine-D-alanine ligase|nr:D-alanine--D-alanine ligase [Lachnospiraceae bacterium]